MFIWKTVAVIFVARCKAVVRPLMNNAHNKYFMVKTTIFIENISPSNYDFLHWYSVHSTSLSTTVVDVFIFRESLVMIYLISLKIFLMTKTSTSRQHSWLLPPSPSWPLITLCERRLMVATCRSDGAQSPSGSVRAQSETGSSGGRKVDISQLRLRQYFTPGILH